MGRPVRLLLLVIVAVVIVLFNVSTRLAGTGVSADPRTAGTRSIAEQSFFGGSHFRNALSRKVKATFVVLARNENLWGIASSVQQVEDRFNWRYNYDWVFLNDVDFTDDFRNLTSSLTSGNAYYGRIPEEHWSIPEWINPDTAAAARQRMKDEGVGYGDSLSYRHMCRYESGFFFRHPLLEQYDYYWRVEPDVKFFCDLPYDPFRFMHENNKQYSFVIAFEEYINTIPTLWDHVKTFMKDYSHHLPVNNALSIVSDDGGETYNKCHFWSNFEIGSLTWLRSKPYLDFFSHLDRAGGFHLERWGDAPVHSIAAALLLPPEQIHFFDDIGYYHYPYTHCPNNAARRRELRCTCDPGQNHDWTRDACTKHWYKANGLVPPDGRDVVQHAFDAFLEQQRSQEKQ